MAKVKAKATIDKKGKGTGKNAKGDGVNAVDEGRPETTALGQKSQDRTSSELEQRCSQKRSQARQQKTPHAVLNECPPNRDPVNAKPARSVRGAIINARIELYHADRVRAIINAHWALSRCALTRGCAPRRGRPSRA